MDKTALGKRLREARLKMGYTQQALAAQAEIGEVYLGEIERGLKMPSMNTFIKITETLQISADYILRDDLTSGSVFIFDEITEKLKDLTPQQRKTATEILDAYIKNL
ncbi:MAG: helix-turn-helix transcriptional regulator [Oscillospiraceae bacterium]|nr:helix-turn-helix transcriptional regulator [Oscillospiraceae bacterium]